MMTAGIYFCSRELGVAGSGFHIGERIFIMAGL